MGDGHGNGRTGRDAFACTLRQLRRSAGLTQEGLVAALDGTFARSTLANIEAGREAPSSRFFHTVSTRFPQWHSDLVEPFDLARHQLDRDIPTAEHPQRTSLGPLGGKAVAERVRTTYVFRDGPAPAEILITHRLRATTSGVAGHVARLQTASARFEGDAELVEGGRLRGTERLVDASTTTLLQHIAFDVPLQRGQTHVLTTRWTVRRDPTPATLATLIADVPTAEAEIRLRFLGARPASIESFGPVADRALLHGPDGLVRYHRLTPADDVIATFAGPALGVVYGARWAW